MQYEQNLNRMKQLSLHGMYEQYLRDRDAVHVQDALSHDERLALLLDAEEHSREQRRQDRFLRQAKLKDVTASIENIDYQPSRGLKREQVTSLAECDWVNRNRHMIFIGATGVGKTFTACAFGHQAIRKGYKVIYRRLPRLLEELEIAYADGSLPKLRLRLSKFKVLILDDWAVNPLSARHRRDLLELIEDKTGTGSIIITSQLPISEWHEWIGEPTIADAVLDRLIHRAHKIELRGDSMRKLQAKNTGEQQS